MKMKAKRVLLALMGWVVMLPVAGQSHGNDHVDDVLQHIPRLGVFVLNVCGVESRTQGDVHYYTNTMGSYLLAAGVTAALKSTVKEWRPDRSDRRSFPSGHATFAFAGAHILQKEYGQHSPWISAGGYILATGVAIDRVVQDRHHWYDVCAGAAVGVLCTELTYFVTDRLFPATQASVAIAPNGLMFSMRF